LLAPVVVIGIVGVSIKAETMIPGIEGLGRVELLSLLKVIVHRGERLKVTLLIALVECVQIRAIGGSN